MDNKSRWAQAAGFLGVVASLLVVAYEIKQSRDIATAEIYQQKAALTMNLNMAPINDLQLLAAMAKLYDAPRELDIMDFGMLTSYWAARFAYYENNHFQYQMGMITEEQMNTIRSEITSNLSHSLARWWWQRTSEDGAWRKSFVDEVEDLLAKFGPADVPDPSSRSKFVNKIRCIAAGDCPIDPNSP